MRYQSASIISQVERVWVEETPTRDAHQRRPPETRVVTTNHHNIHISQYSAPLSVSLFTTVFGYYQPATYLVCRGAVARFYKKSHCNIKSRRT